MRHIFYFDCDDFIKKELKKTLHQFSRQIKNTGYEFHWWAIWKIKKADWRGPDWFIVERMLTTNELWVREFQSVQYRQRPVKWWLG